MRPLSVSELNAQIKGVLEQTFIDIHIQGEIGSVKIHTSGHIYLTLKDEQSSVRCVMFKGNARTLTITLEVGQQVQIFGALSIFAPKGEYQILCKRITLAGFGELARAYETLKNKLASLGYFDSAHKKPIPKFPKRIALLTSATGAAKEDMLKVASKRWNLTHITLFNTIVQGADAKDSIQKNIQYVDSLFGTQDAFDIIILGRGGGSMEDMWVFNEECIATAIFNARTPIVSAIGHEVDTFISDFVADMRAPTPSAAMEMILPDSLEWLRILDELQTQFAHALSHCLSLYVSQIQRLKKYFLLYNFESQRRAKNEQLAQLAQLFQTGFHTQLTRAQNLLDSLSPALTQRFETYITHTHFMISNLTQALEAHNPHALYHKGYAQITKNGKPCTLKQIALNEHFTLSDLEQSIESVRIK